MVLKSEDGVVPDDLTPEEQQELENIRRRKQELLEDIQRLKDEIAEVTSEIENLGSTEERKNMQRNKQVAMGRKKFNMDPKKGIQFLIENDLLKNTSDDIAQFLYKGEGLNKTAIGDYLGERDDFNIQVLHAFVELHEFTDLNLVQALRQFLWSFRLPGEAQKIDRMMEAFAQRYCQCNPGVFQSTEKGRELADMMERRKVDILCVQETRWKGSKARSIGAGFKLFYYGVDSKRNGVGVVLKEEFVRNVLEVKRVSDRVMTLKLEIEGVMLNVVSGYAPQVGCELEEKERFWSELDEVMESIPTGHVGEGNRGDEEVMGKFGVKERNLEGQMVVDFAKRMDMAVVNTYFQKREEHRVTYKSGDLEKAYDRVPREELWYCMRKSGVAEKYVRVVQDMYERSRTVVRCAVGQTEEFKVEVGLHQGSALSPFLFAIVMEQLSEEVRQESPWTMMFADDIVICSESREQVEENLERWRFALERRGMKVSRSKTEYMCVNEREGSGTVRLQGEEVKKVQEFKNLGSTVQSNGECGKEVKKRVQAGWNGWRKASGVLCDRKISARIKGKVYRTVVRPAMLYGLETVSLRKRQESELEVAELKMLRFSLGVTRLDWIRNEYIRGTAHVGRLGDKVREARLRWFGHVQRRESEHIDTCYILSFAIIMLNTSLHNPNVKDKPTVERFISMNRGINDGGDLPEELLRNLYESIKNEPFKIPEDDGNDLTHTFFNPDREGWLLKLGGRVKTWKRRWFILTDNCLYYFEYTTDKEPRGIIPLENLSIREVEDKKPNCFELFIPDNKDQVIKACKTEADGRVVEGNHTFYRISAPTTEEKDEWINSIKAAISRDPFYEMLAARKKKVSSMKRH
ncbi:hypothetical protein QTP86_032750 [Hemibagrus guttatus]|nr:hypothetical protein QTP86_032750 [Hemibagrus guttatus]